MVQVNEKVSNYDEFKVDITTFDEPRKPGISAILRIKNGAEFLRSSIETHIPYYDEIIACYNDCTDNTAEILHELKEKYPEKIKVFEYLPKVHPIFSDAHNSSATDNVHSLANFYNYTLSKTSYSMATKLDDDHIAIDRNLKPVISRIRNDIASNIKKIYTFSGVNLALDSSNKLGVYVSNALVGTGDHMYFPLSSNIYFSQGIDMEAFEFKNKKYIKEYVGILYFHLKYLKDGYGFKNSDEKRREEELIIHKENYYVISLEEFISDDNFAKLIKYHNPIEFWLRSNTYVNAVIFALFKKNPPLRIARLHQLFQDLNGINLDECVTKRLRKF
ncbi:hypothetical protein ACE02G_07175 [Shewanella xiamenensis]|uniref:hypothetical protein n=1 Tax=Shewanella xiamenensis TaxID=332186 RepID=UPI0035BA8B4A